MKLESFTNLLSGPWFLQQEWGDKAVALLLTLAQGNNIEAISKTLNCERKPNYIFTEGNLVSTSDFSTVKGEKTIAIININGPIFREYTDFLINSFKAIKSNPAIGGVIALVDTPGGHGMGLQELATTIQSLSIPKVAFINDTMMCSAGYWIGCNFDSIFSGTQTSTVGSIGSFIKFSNTDGLFEKIGIKISDIYAPQSTEKNLAFKEAKKGNEEPIKDRLKFFTEIFINTVKTTRNGKINLTQGDPFKGADYTAADAIKVGLIDGIKTYDEVVSYVQELIPAQTQNSNSNSNTMFNKFPKLTALKGKKAEEITAEEITAANKELDDFGIVAVGLIDEKQLDNSDKAIADFDALKATSDKVTADLATANETIATMTTAAEKATTDLATVNTALTTANTALETANTEITALKAQVVELGGKPGAESTNPVKKTEETEPATPGAVPAFESYKHNQEMMEKAKNMAGI